MTNGKQQQMHTTPTGWTNVAAFIYTGRNKSLILTNRLTSVPILECTTQPAPCKQIYPITPVIAVCFERTSPHGRDPMPGTHPNFRREVWGGTEDGPHSGIGATQTDCAGQRQMATPAWRKYGFHSSAAILTGTGGTGFKHQIPHNKLQTHTSLDEWIYFKYF